MIKIGDNNILKINRFVDFGAYLSVPDGSDKNEVLLPKRYVDDEMQPGDEIKVFVYTDSEDRPVATTETPFATVGEFVFLQTVQVNRVGAFLDWGLQKNLLVPFKEQKIKMFPGGIYLVYIYLDHTTGRVVASAKIEKFLGNVMPEYKKGDKVKCLVISHAPIGYQVIVDNLHRGMIYSNEVYRPIEIGKHLEAYVKNVREEDGKIDLTLSAPGTRGRIEKIADMILENLKSGKKILNEKSSAEEIAQEYQCSKKDFKKAIGLLYRNHQIDITITHNIILVR